MKLRNTNEAKKRIELDREVVADLEASETDGDAVRGGANYSRVAATIR